MFPHAGLLIFPDSRDSLVLTFPSTETAERISLPLIVLEKMSQFPLGAKLGESSRGPLLNILSSLLIKFLTATTNLPSICVTYDKKDPFGPATGLALYLRLKVMRLGRPTPWEFIE